MVVVVVVVVDEDRETFVCTAKLEYLKTFLSE